MEVKLEEAHTGSSQLVPGKGIPDILYEDEDLLCVNKPAGLVVHPSHGHYADSLSNMLAFYFREKGVQARVRSVGRAWMGHPLLGDRLYGGNTEHMKRAALHAFRVTLIQPFTEEEIRIQAAFPDDMQKCLEAKRSEIK